MKILLLCLLAFCFIPLMYRLIEIEEDDYTKQYKQELRSPIHKLIAYNVCLMVCVAIFPLKEIFN